MIRCSHITFSYENGHPILDDLNLTIRPGESVGIIGANGAGKSTLMKILLGLLPCQGDAWVNDIHVEKKNFASLRRALGYVLQDSDNQMFMPTVYDDMTFAPRNYGLSDSEIEERINTVLADLGIEKLKHRYNHRLSGGEKRMSAIATILAMDPSAIIMDEPTIALDPYNRRKVINAVNRLTMTKIIVSHDLDMILDTCERVILLSAGRIAADGPAQEILRDRELLEANRMELPLRLQG